MPVQSSKSGFMAKLGPKIAAAHEAHKNDETKYGSMGDLPPGIEGGVAELKEVKIDQFKTGDFTNEYYFSAYGIAVVPKTMPDGRVVQGGRTRIGPEPLCDTPARTRKEFADHYAWMLNHLRLLGVDTSSMGPDDLESVMAALSQGGLYFRFRTWQGEATEQYPDPRVNHEWLGLCDPPPGLDSPDGGAVKDNSPAKASNGAPAARPNPAKTGPATPPAAQPAAQPAATRASAPAAARPSTKAATKPAPAPTPAPQAAEPTPEPAEDVQALVDLAEEQNGDAQARLTELAVAAGASEEQVSAAQSWQEVADLIVAPAAEGAAEGEWEGPKKEDVFTYSPIDPKTKKPYIDTKTKKARKPIEVEVLAVDKAKKTAKVKSLDDGKTTYDVTWDDLQPSA